LFQFYFNCADSFTGKLEGTAARGRQREKCLDSICRSADVGEVSE